MRFLAINLNIKKCLVHFIENKLFISYTSKKFKLEFQDENLTNYYFLFSVYFQKIDPFIANTFKQLKLNLLFFVES